MMSRAKDIVFEKKHWGFRHLIFWVIWIGFVCLSTGGDNTNLQGPILVNLSVMPLIIAYVYVILYVFVPGFLFRGRYVAFFAIYCVWVSLGLVAIYLFSYYVSVPVWSGTRAAPLDWKTAYGGIVNIGNFQLMNTIAISGVFIKLFKRWHREVTRKIQIEQEKASAELELLKAQLHPHFLFNTLNNLYTLVLEQSDRAPDLLLRLSGLLTYVLYDCKANDVLLEKEIAVMKDYIGLEWERYGNRLEVSQDFSGDLAGMRIAPMLFQPFVENAFKHGTSEQVGKVWINIELSVRNEKLFFRVINSVDWTPGERPPGGIGVNNTRRRLDLLYPSRYTLRQDRGEEVYVVTLTIDLRKKSGQGINGN